MPHCGLRHYRKPKVNEAKRVADCGSFCVGYKEFFDLATKQAKTLDSVKKNVIYYLTVSRLSRATKYYLR